MTMEYRRLGRTGLDVSAIGLGTEHLEKQKETIEEVLRTAVDAGVSYVDLLHTGLDYWDEFGPIFRSYRDKLILAAHWGSGPRYDLDYCKSTFDHILSCLGNNYVEVAMMTMVDQEKKWNGWIQESVEHLNRYKEQGRIGYIGGSGHGAPMAIKAINSGLFDVFMFPVNMVGHDNKGISTLCQACMDKNVGLVAMKPYFGGTLLYVDGKVTSITPAQCLAYVFSLPVSTAVPGPKNMRELQATLHYLEATEEEKDYCSVIINMYVSHCVYCNHCLPCPQDINIGWLISSVDQARGGITDDLLKGYSNFKVKASECTECGVCMERCPFEVDVVAKMRRAVELFETRS